MRSTVGFFSPKSAYAITGRAHDATMVADELKTFNERYARASSRADMPTRFNEIAEATSRASRIWLASTVAILLVLVWIIFVVIVAVVESNVACRNYGIVDVLLLCMNERD